MNLQKVNIDSFSPHLHGRVLSNFFESPFELDGHLYRSVESFWQSLKFPENSEERNLIRDMEGLAAKAIGKKKNKTITEIVYQGRSIPIGSHEHHLLLKRALLEKYNQNREIAQILMDTGNAELTHFLVRNGVELPDSSSIPREVFCGILQEIREELRSKSFHEDLSDSSMARLVSASYASEIGRTQDRIYRALQDDYRDPDAKEYAKQELSSLKKLLRHRDREYMRLLHDHGIDLSKIYGNQQGDILLDPSDIDMLPESHITTHNFIKNPLYNRVGTNKTSSRGLGYYFNLPGLSEQKKETNGHQRKPLISLDTERYYEEILKYSKEVIDSLREINVEDIPSNQKVNKITLFLFDHLRNILIFLKGQGLFFLDAENLSRLMSTGQVNKQNLGKNYIDDLRSIFTKDDEANKTRLMEMTDESILLVIEDYFNTIMGTPRNIDEKSLDNIEQLISEMVHWLKEYMTNAIKSLGKDSKTLHTRLILNTVRVFRESDSPIKTYYSCMNFIGGHRYEIEHLDSVQIIGMPYGGIEVPYILKYLLGKELPKLQGKIHIDHLILPPYIHRGQTPFVLKEHKIKSPNLIITDDNVNLGSTISYAQAMLSPYTDRFYALAVDGSNDLNPVSTSVLDTISGFNYENPEKPGTYGNALSQSLVRDWGIIGRV